MRLKPVGVAYLHKRFPRVGLAQPGVGYVLGLQADLVLPLCTKVAPYAKVVAEIPAAAKWPLGVWCVAFRYDRPMPPSTNQGDCPSAKR